MGMSASSFLAAVTIGSVQWFAVMIAYALHSIFVGGDIEATKTPYRYTSGEYVCQPSYHLLQLPASCLAVYMSAKGDRA